MGRNRIIIIITVLLAVSALALVEDQFLESAGSNPSQSWMFKGAYAIYEGKIDTLSTPCNLTEEIQVIDLNASMIQVRTTSTIATSFTPALTDQTVCWFNKTGVNFQPPGETLARTYDAQIPVRNIGIRNCTVYQYTNEAINAIYYVDKALLWPVRISYTTVFENQTYVMEFNLKDTNIKGLN